MTLLAPGVDYATLPFQVFAYEKLADLDENPSIPDAPSRHLLTVLLPLFITPFLTESRFNQATGANAAPVATATNLQTKASSYSG